MYRLDPPKARWEIQEKVVETKRAKILLDFQIQTDRQVLARHHGSRQDQKTATVLDVLVPNDSNIRKKAYEKLQKY